MSVADTINLAGWFLTLFALFIAWRELRNSRNQFQFEIMINCITRFQEIVQHLDAADDTQRLNAYQRYVDLCNEEMFYFVNEWVPEEVEKEWLDGMINLMPHINDAGQNLNDDSVITFDYLADYPRIRHAFLVRKKYDLESRYDRNALIESIQKQLRSYEFDSRR